MAMAARWWARLDWRHCLWSIGPSWLLDERQQVLVANGLPSRRLPQQIVVALGLFLRAGVGRIVTRDDLIRAIWGKHAVVTDAAIDQVVKRSRDAFGDHRAFLKTLKGKGWMLDFAALPRIEQQPLAESPREKFELCPGAAIPGRPDFTLTRQLSEDGRWLARSASGQECEFQFGDYRQLAVFIREWEQFQKLSEHPKASGLAGFVQLHGVPNLRELPLFVEREHYGETLVSWGPRELSDLGLAERVGLCAQIARCLVPAHELAIPYGRLTPGQVRVARGTHGFEVKLAVGKGLGPLDLLEIGRDGNELLYVPPEVRGNPSAPASLTGDSYAFAVLSLQVMAGDFLLSADPGAVDVLPDLKLRQYVLAGAYFDPRRRASIREMAGWLSAWR
jgi:DNA-binding winged helix-turn-helix (wHTH) protein